MSVHSVKNHLASASTDTTLTAAETQRRASERCQNLSDQYENAVSDWGNVSAAAKTYAGESVCLAIDGQLTEADAKLKELQAAVYALGEMVDTEAEEVKNEKMAEVLGALLAKLNINIASVSLLATNGTEVDALREIWEGISDADKAYLGQAFVQAIEAQFSALNAKISELKGAISAGAEPSVIEQLQTEIAGLKAQLDTIINGTADGSVLSITDRIDCLKSLEEAKGHLSDKQYAMFREQLLQTDIAKQTSKADFETQLEEIVLEAVQKSSQKAVGDAENTSQSYATQNELIKNNIALKVIQAKNSLFEFELNSKADEALQAKGDFNPHVQRLRDEGRWQMPEVTRQQEITSERINEERRRETATKVQ